MINTLPLLLIKKSIKVSQVLVNNNHLTEILTKIDKWKILIFQTFIRTNRQWAYKTDETVHMSIDEYPLGVGLVVNECGIVNDEKNFKSYIFSELVQNRMCSKTTPGSDRGSRDCMSNTFRIFLKSNIYVLLNFGIRFKRVLPDNIWKRDWGPNK